MRAYRIAALFIACASSAYAGAWVQPKGKGQVITTLRHYKTNAFFDENRDRGRKTGSYHKTSAEIYAEYGLAPAWTAGVQTSYQWIEARGGSAGGRTSGLADTSFFLRERLWEGEGDVFSIQQLVSVPGGYDERRNPALGYGQIDLELRALYGHSGTVEELAYFADLQGAYRKRFEGPADEIRADATVGLKPKEGYMLLAQSFNTIGLGNASTTAFVTPSGPDYDLSTLSLSGVIDVPYDFSVQAGASTDIAGRNTGGGNTVFIALWRNF